MSIFGLRISLIRKGPNSFMIQVVKELRVEWLCKMLLHLVVDSVQEVNKADGGEVLGLDVYKILSFWKCRKQLVF